MKIEEILNGMDMITFLIECRRDFKFFCERLLGITEFGGTQKFHLEWFELMRNNDKVLIQAPSGFAKTTIFEAYALWLIWNYRNKNILIIANTLENARRILDNIKSFIEKNDIIGDLKPDNNKETWNKQEIKVTTKCRIVVKPYTENMRGERADFCLVDEADAKAYSNTKIFFEHVLSRLNPGAKIALISTPESTKGLMSFIRSTNKGDYVFKKYKAITDYVNEDLSTGKSIWEERFPMKDLMVRLSSMGREAFMKVYMCDEKAESQESLFKLIDLTKGFDTRVHFSDRGDGGIVCLACDFAYSTGPKADFDAYVVIEKKDNFFIIRHIEIWHGITTPVKASRIMELYEKYHPELVVFDESNIGHSVIEEMYSRGLAVILQKFSSQERKKLLLTLQNVVQSGRLVIPRDADYEDEIRLTDLLVEQLVGFVKTESERGVMDIIDSRSVHDDVAMATAMAVKELTRQITESFY